MVQCVILGCNNESGKDKVSFFSLPKVVHDGGEQMLTITTERRCAWLRAISRDDLGSLDNVVVCERHFHEGK